MTATAPVRTVPGPMGGRTIAFIRSAGVRHLEDDLRTAGSAISLCRDRAQPSSSRSAPAALRLPRIAWTRRIYDFSSSTPPRSRSSSATHDFEARESSTTRATNSCFSSRLAFACRSITSTSGASKKPNAGEDGTATMSSRTSRICTIALVSAHRWRSRSGSTATRLFLFSVPMCSMQPGPRFTAAAMLVERTVGANGEGV